MAYEFLFWSLFMFGCSIEILSATSTDDPYMSKEEREILKEEARDMFYHAYNAYMDNAYPADELMPLSCKGRYRGSSPNRGDIDATLGNFSLTLVDTLDTLVVLGDLEEFENAVKLVARDVSFDTDVIVSLFETNIRMLGGLLSGHILAEYLQQRADIMPWYRGELLDLAKDLGYRFLPAFNTSTGIPYGRINLKYGMKGVPMEVSRETCTACAGSMILEMAALSRLTGESVFEEKAQKAMDELWRMRHRGTDLMGSVLNVNSGDWVRRDSGVGAGIDSYYEYCLKAYILLGDEKYLGRFNKHYQAVMKYVSQGPMLLDVHMHRPNTNSKNFMDALLAFWPGLQVLKGDIKPAVETHEMLYQVMQRHNFIPEAFTTDFQVHWGYHPLRPEFLESTYFLYRATGDHYYLGVGRKVLKSLQTFARVPCGYAAVSDVRTNKHDDTMDSFVLSETFKYLFLLFAESTDLVLDLDEFIFTTEGHLLPLTLASVRTNISSEFERDVIHVDEFDRTCPNSLHLFPASVRQPLTNMVEDVCPRQMIKRRLSASQFQANNFEHLKILSDMGITRLILADGRVQLFHTFSNARTPQDSEEGLLFMQEMVQLSKMQSQQVATETNPQAVSFIKPDTYPPQKITLPAGPAHFGPDLQSFTEVTGKIVTAYPLRACSDLEIINEAAGKIVVMMRGDCMFIEKARRIQQAGAIAGIVVDNVAGSSAAISPMFAMSGDDKEVNDVKIPVVFLFTAEASVLMEAVVASKGEVLVTIVSGSIASKEEVQLKAPTDLSMFERLKGSLKPILTQQVIPQTPRNRGTNSGIAVPEYAHQEEKPDTVAFQHLRAEMIKDSLGGEIRITTTSEPPTDVTRKTKESSTLEEQWRQLKEIFLKQIYSKTKQETGFRIRTVILESYYDWVSKGRGVNNPNKHNDIPLTHKVSWFLKELSEVSPNPSITRIGQLMYPNKQKLLKQYVLMKMDTLVMNFKNIATKLKPIRFLKPEIRYVLRLSESSTLQFKIYSILRSIFLKLGDTEDEYFKQHMALVEHIHDDTHIMYNEIFFDDLQTNVEKTDKGENWYHEILIDNLQRSFKTLIEVQQMLKKVEKFEEQRIDEYMGDNNETEKFGDFEYAIPNEIVEAARNFDQSILQKYENISNISKDLNSGQNQATIKAEKLVQSTSQNQSKDENLENEVENPENKKTNTSTTMKLEDEDIEDKPDAKNEASTSNNDKISISTEDTQSTKGLLKNEKNILQEAKSNVDNLKTSHGNDLNIPMSSQKSVNKNVYIDSLKNFKKSTRTSKEERNNLSSQEELVANSKRDNTRNNQGKHIQDEL